MSHIAPRLEQLLDAAEIEYEILHHRPDYRAESAAIDTHTPPDQYAKSVVLFADEHPVLAVIPSPRTVSLRRVAEATGAEEVRMADESEVARLFPDCEIGAAPPFGNLYDMAVYVSPMLAADEHITFNAGTHRDAVRLRFADFERLVRPVFVRLCKQE